MKNYTRLFCFLINKFLFINEHTSTSYKLIKNLNMINPRYREDITIDEVLDLVGMTGTGDRKVYSA